MIEALSNIMTSFGLSASAGLNAYLPLLICGILIAGAVHTVKATARPLVTATTAGTANPVVSTAEDVVSGLVSLLSILVPIVAVILIAVGVYLILRASRRLRARA
jgi:hypothetical protein